MSTKAHALTFPLTLTTPRPIPLATGLVLAASDLAAVVISAVMAFQIWLQINPQVSQLFSDLWPVLGLFAVVFAVQGLYPGIGMTPVEELQKLITSTTLVYLLLSASMFLSKNIGTASRGVIGLAWLFSVVALPVFRGAVYRAFASRSWWGAPVLLLGAGRTAELVIRELRNKPALGFKPVACLDDDELKRGYCADVPVVNSLASADQLASEYGIQYAILAMPGVKRERLMYLLDLYSGVFPHVILVPDLFGIASLWVSPRDLGGVLGLELRHNLLMPLNRWFKRGCDVAAAIVLGVFALPIIAVAALWIKAVSPGKAFFLQPREGEGGRLIQIPKLRTMFLGAEELLDSYLASNPEARIEWDRHCKLKNDPRILPWIGRLLRRTSLDELPQLWSVIKGEMSLVGPRPFPAYHNAKFDPRFRDFRTKVTPGLTGLWQVSDRSEGDLDVQAKLDTYYIRNWSPWLDLYILGRTLRAVIAGRGAY